MASALHVTMATTKTHVSRLLQARRTPARPAVIAAYRTGLIRPR